MRTHTRTREYTLLGMDASSEDSGLEELYKNPDDDFLPREAAATSEKESHAILNYIALPIH